MQDNTEWKVKDLRYVAYLDILGFKDYVMRNSIHTVYSRLKALNALRPEEQDPDYESETSKRIKFTIFSDSVFIFSKDDDFVSLRHFLTYVKRVMRMALRKEIPLKGAIAYGNMAVDVKNNLFCGQPIVDAYLLEEDLQYMGVVFHHTFEEAYFKLSDTQIKRVSNWIKEVSTPFRYGKRTHLNLDYRIAGSTTYDLKERIENQRFYSSGDARKYIDNTLEMIRLFENKKTNQD